MSEEAVRHGGQGALRHFVGDGDRLVAEVAAGDHKGPGQLVQEEVVQAGGGQEQADPGQPGVDFGSERSRAPTPPAPAQQHHGALRRGEGLSLAGTDLRKPGGRLDVRDHHGERFRRTALAAP